MLQFWDLELKDQLTVIGQVTQTLHLNDFQTKGAILPHTYYDQRKASTSLSAIIRQMHPSDKLIQSVLTVLSQPTFTNLFDLYNSWGFALQKDGKNVLVCTNLIGYDSKRVIIICLDDLINSPRIEYHYADKVQDRWKIIYAGFGFAITAFLLDAVNKFPIQIQ
jgi:hypothetical protein